MITFIKNLQNQVDSILDYVGHYYIYTIVTLYVIYIFVLLGVLTLESTYLRIFNAFIQAFICLFLILRFHPFRKHELHASDARIIFSSATFLLFNLGIIEYFTTYGTNLLNSLEKKIVS